MIDFPIIPVVDVNFFNHKCKTFYINGRRFNLLVKKIVLIFNKPLLKRDHKNILFSICFYMKLLLFSKQRSQVSFVKKYFNVIFQHWFFDETSFLVFSVLSLQTHQILLSSLTRVETINDAVRNQGNKMWIRRHY